MNSQKFLTGFFFLVALLTNALQFFENREYRLRLESTQTSPKPQATSQPTMSPIVQKEKNTQVDSWIEGDIIYTIESRGDEDNPYEIVFKEQNGKLEVLTILKPGLFASSDIIDLYNVNNTLLLSTSGGDGCGMTGTIWTLRGTYREAVVDFGSGCIENNIPRFVAYKDGLLILYKQIGNVMDNTERVTEVYSLNPFTREKKILFAKADIPEGTNSVSEENGEIKLKTL